MMIQEIKTQLYQLLSEKLQMPIVDYSYNKVNVQTFPNAKLAINNIQRVAYKNCGYGIVLTISLDIFSDKLGEEELLSSEEIASEVLEQLANSNDKITYAEQTRCRILDDKSTGTVKKHMSLLYRILCMGEYEEVVDNE